MERNGRYMELTADDDRQGRIILESRLNFALFAAGMLVVAGCFFFMISAMSL